MHAAPASPLAGLVDAHEAAEAAHDAQAAAGTFAADGVLDPKPLGTTVTGRAAIADWYAELFEAFPDFTPRVVRRYQDGDVVMDEVEITATHLGRFVGIPATGRPLTVPAAIVYEFARGELVRETAYWDVATMLVQMGVLPAPGS
jgi:steroid delta-isomerase-like uncharacterized protein